MRPPHRESLRRSARSFFPPSLLALALVSPAARGSAGPPLLCRPVEIGTAGSLPWGAGWKEEDRAYDRKRLVGDTLDRLAPATTVLVRMETLRRAALYARRHPALARELRERLRERAERDSGIAWFDAGYLVEAQKQAAWIEEDRRGEAPAEDGLAWIERALRALPPDPALELGAALATLDHGPARDTKAAREHERHLAAALAGASPGSLLERNLLLHFSHRGTTLDALRASLR